MEAINRQRVLGRALVGSSDETYLWATARRAYDGAENLTSALIKERLYGITASRPEIEKILGATLFGQLTRRRSETAAANLILLQSYDEIADALTRNSIRFMPTKGCDLVGTLYGDPGERTMADIDILVHPSDFDRAVAIATGLGYVDIKYRFRLPGVWASTTMYGKVGEFSGHLDLHYCPGPEIGKRRLETRRLFSQWEPGTRPSNEQRLLFSVIHQQNHFFDSSLADLYEFLILAKRVNADAFTELTSRWGANTAASIVFGQVAFFFSEVEPIDGWRRSVIGNIINRNVAKPAGHKRLGSVITFTLSTDRPTEAIRFGVKLFLKKYKKKNKFIGKKP